MTFSRLEKDLVFQIADWDAFWEEAAQVESGILCARYTKGGEIQRTYVELTELLGRSRVRRHLAKAIRLMRHPVRAKEYRGRTLTDLERLG